MKCVDCYNSNFDFDTCFGKSECEDGFPSYDFLKKENEELALRVKSLEQAMEHVRDNTLNPAHTMTVLGLECSQQEMDQRLSLILRRQPWRMTCS